MLLKKLVSVLLIAVFLVQALDKLWIVASFELNRDYIVRVLCLNKSKPALACGGKCHLSQQFKTADAQKKEQIPTPAHEKTEVLYLQQITESLPSKPMVVLVKVTPLHSLAPCVGYVQRVFHPPQYFIPF